MASEFDKLLDMIVDEATAKYQSGGCHELGCECWTEYFREEAKRRLLPLLEAGERKRHASYCYSVRKIGNRCNCGKVAYDAAKQKALEGR